MEQEEFFSSNHKRLLTIANWARYLAWIALVAYILLAGLQILPRQSFGDFPPPDTQLEQLRRVAGAAVVLLRGVIYYLVLKGISLGLNMIVETNINYRERQEQDGAQ